MRKAQPLWRLNNMLLENQQIDEDIKGTIRKYLKTNQNGIQIKMEYISKSIGCSKNRSKGKLYGNEGLPQETRKISNKQPNLLTQKKRKRKRRTTKPKEK